MNISRGGLVTNGMGWIGQDSAVNVDGVGSRWENYAELYIDNGGTLNITGGGVVTTLTDAYIGYYSSSHGIVNVCGSGSEWENDSTLHIGYNEGNGQLNITNGGLVTARHAFIGADSVLSIGVSNNGMLIDDGDFANDGKVLLTAEAGLAAGTYTPISVAGYWSDSGTYETFGGIWDESLHTFTVADAMHANAGHHIEIMNLVEL